MSEIVASWICRMCGYIVREDSDHYLPAMCPGCSGMSMTMWRRGQDVERPRGILHPKSTESVSEARLQMRLAIMNNPEFVNSSQPTVEEIDLANDWIVSMNGVREDTIYDESYVVVLLATYAHQQRILEAEELERV